MGTRTFLFVDQVGSTEQLTRLGDRVAQPVRRALFDLLRQATEVHAGHEVDFTGDGMFCAFAGAADAVAAAVSMQQLVVSFNRRRPDDHHLAVRIGLHSGEPLESEGGGYFGAAVVVAARLCSKAAAGQVLASGLVRSLVEPRGEHTFQPVGALTLKGVPVPVDAFAVAWAPDDRRGQLPALLAAAGTTAFVGRRAELAAVSDVWEREAERALVLVSGDHGMGVTRLLAEAAEGFRRCGASVWAGAGHGTEARLAPWGEAVGTWAAATPRAELRLALGEKAADLRRLVPGLADLVPRLPEPPPVDPATEVFLVADAVDELATRWSRIEPLVVVLDDLHDADRATLTVLERVTGSRRGGRVLVLAGYEPSAVGAPRVLSALRGAHPAADLRLGGLDRDDVRDLVGALTGREVTDDSLRAVLAESEGTPYFVVEMARSLKERAITGQVRRAVDRAGALQTDLRLQREEITLALRELGQLREEPHNGNGARLDPDGTPPAAGDPPYRGLLAFDTGDAGSFFGRDELVAEMTAHLLSARWLAVIGPSGSGKSSAVRAGLVPALASGALPDSDTWVSAVCTPGPEPLGALGAALAAVSGGGDGRRSAERLRTESLARVALDATDGRRLLLVVDQFEEVWTTTGGAARRRTLDLLVEGVSAAEGNVLVVVCLRADHYGRTAENGRLAALLAGSQVLVPPMTTAELRAAVELPARRAGWVLEPGLAQAVVDDVADEPGALPLLSTAMLETWERRRGRSLTLAGYAETGGARRAIANLADSTLDEMTPEDQEVARHLLLRLAAPTERGDDVARPAPLRELVVDEGTERVLARLAERRLVAVGATTAQVAHEALLREWPRMRSWLEADRDGRRLHQQIATATTQWHAAGRDDDGLLRGARLAAADDWRADHEDALSAPEREFLTASVDARQRELRRARRTTRRFQLLAVVLVVLLAGAAVAGGIAVVSSRTAKQRATEATARGLAAQAAALAPTRVDTALLLAVEGYRRNPSPDTEGGLLAALNGARFLSTYRHELPAASDVDVSPDLTTVAVLTRSGEVRLFDASTWKPEGPPLVSGLTSPLYLRYSPTGDLLAYADDHGVHVIDARTGRRAGPPQGGGVNPTFAFSSDERVLVVSGGPDQPGIRIVDLRTGELLGQIADAGAALVVARPGSDELAVGFVDHPAPIRRYRFDGSPLGEPSSASVQVQGMDYTPDGGRLIVTDFAAVTGLYDPQTLAPIGRPVGSSGSRIYDDDVTPDGRLVALAADDGSIRLARTDDGTTLATVSGLANGGAVSFLDGHRLLAMTPDESAVFDLEDLTPLGHSTRLDFGVTYLAGLAGGRAALFGQGDRLSQVDSSGAIRSTGVTLPVGTDGPVTLSPDGHHIAVLGHPVTQAEDPNADAEVLIADRRTGDVVSSARVSGDEQAALGGRVAFSPDGSRLAVGTFGGVLSILDSTSGRVLVERRTDIAAVVGLRWASDGSVLYEGGQDGVLRFLDPRTLKPEHEVSLTPQFSVTDIVPVPGTALLAVASERGDVWFVDRQTQSVVGDPLVAEGTQLQAVALTPDGRRLAAVSRDGGLRIWDRASGRAIGPPLAAHAGPALAIAYLDGDNRLVTGSLDGTMVVWDMLPQDWARRACALAGRDLTRGEWQRYLTDQPYRRTCGGL